MKPFTFTDQNFQTAVRETRGLVLVDFWAPWCGPCQAMNPVMEELARTYEGKIIVGKLNTDEHPRTAVRYGIRSIPTLLFFQNGDVIDRIIGVMPKPQLEKRMNTLLSMGSIALDQVAS